VWIHHGQYDHYSHTKFVPGTLSPDGLREACEHAISNGAQVPLSPEESLDSMLARLEPSIFDAGHEPVQTDQSEGVDIVAASAVNYFDPGVTTADIDSLPPEWRNRLNVRYARGGGETVPEPYKVGGLYGEELQCVSHFLRLALPHAESDEQRRSIELLLDYYQDGDEETFREHCIHWLKSGSTIDYVNGFIEVYLDPRGMVGQFEANVSFQAGGGLIDALADHALYFEKRMPWPDEYKRTEADRPVATIVNVLVETGDAGPVSPAAYNLPNYSDIRRDHGSKNVILQNIENTWSRELLREMADEFFLPEYRANVMRYARAVVRPVHVYMHEIIGHGSGITDPSLTEDPRASLGRVYSALEECRADLVALYHFSDDKLIELGAFGADERDVVVETAYITFLQGWFSRFDRIPGTEVREAHNKGHHAILSYLTGCGFGVEVIEKGGDYFVCLTDAARAHEGVAELLSKIQVLDPAWKANVEERRRKLRTPKINAFVFPHLKPVVENGAVVDARILHDEDLTAQQLRFSRLEMSVDATAD
jgi:dipeptidyl-peptidase-3